MSEMNEMEMGQSLDDILTQDVHTESKDVVVTFSGASRNVNVRNRFRHVPKIGNYFPQKFRRIIRTTEDSGIAGDSPTIGQLVVPMDLASKVVPDILYGTEVKTAAVTEVPVFTGRWVFSQGSKAVRGSAYAENAKILRDWMVRAAKENGTPGKAGYREPGPHGAIQYFNLAGERRPDVDRDGRILSTYDPLKVSSEVSMIVRDAVVVYADGTLERIFGAEPTGNSGSSSMSDDETDSIFAGLN